jgi:hypothetical protein
MRGLVTAVVRMEASKLQKCVTGIIFGLAAGILAILTPFILSAVELRWHGLEIPIPPESAITKTLTGPMGSSMAGPSVAHLLKIEAKNAETLQFYRRELEQNGWKEIQSSEEGAWFAKSGRHVFLEFAETSGSSQVKVKYHINQIIAPWVILLLLGMTALHLIKPRFLNCLFPR